MRAFGSAILGLVAILLAAAAFCSAWLEENVVSDSGFTALGQPLGTDAAFQQTLSEAIGRQASDSLQVPSAIAPFVEPVITGAVQGVQSLPEYPQAWEETLSRSHALTFDGGGGVTLDVAPLVGLVTNAVGSETGIEVAAPESSPVPLTGADRRDAVDLLVRAGGAWPYLALGAAAAAVLSLLVARSRTAALAWLGLGALLAGGLLWIGAGSLPALAERPAYGSAVAETFAAAFSVEAAASLQAWTVPFLLGAAVLLVLGLVARSLRGLLRGRAR
ncbi:hypothetical protein OL239_05270 [Arthrobacter sp. ATA002]|uniref:hypothetical protein n=1 Tax=Arthrobacter sp. ATA002 TaxID=2991715 RepID=UPI0022A7FA24|nr:hypothetical protein [Arthrobacter sp. ATA002]WAP52634.1 hypothetical protein OL239_05270 [Arthrobacter sp. ATA002]